MTTIDNIERISISITSDVMAIIILVFLIHLINKNKSFDQILKKRFVNKSILVLVVTALEILGICFEPPKYSAFCVSHSLVDLFGMWVCAVIPLYMAALHEGSLRDEEHSLVFPVYILIAFSGCIFLILRVLNFIPENIHVSEIFHFCAFIISICSLSIFSYSIHKKVQNYDSEEKCFFYSIFTLITLAIIIQIVFPFLYLVWNAIAVSLSLFYVFLKDLQMKYDSLTNVQNRRCFDVNMTDLQDKEAVIIVVLDLNNLKIVNDLYGHLQGDIYIKKAASIINQSFKKIGTVYRVGGDEFCVLCETNNESQILECLGKLTELVEKQKNICTVKFQIAYGYSIYESANNKTIYECFEEADKEMYINKTLSKKQSLKSV